MVAAAHEVRFLVVTGNSRRHQTIRMARVARLAASAPAAGMARFLQQGRLGQVQLQTCMWICSRSWHTCQASARRLIDQPAWQWQRWLALQLFPLGGALPSPDERQPQQSLTGPQCKPSGRGACSVARGPWGVSLRSRFR